MAEDFAAAYKSLAWVAVFCSPLRPANSPADQCITAELYSGGPDLRLQQEIALGIAGWQLLRTLGIEAQVCHLNEGHAALAVIERARSFMEDNGRPFEVALAATRAGNISPPIRPWRQALIVFLRRW